ncbi:MAG: hypothetical protein ACRD3P_01060 [Terriglobales bacterium]
MSALRKWLAASVIAVVSILVISRFLLSVCPSHWMRRVDFGTVHANDNSVPAEIYFTNPNGEGEAVALVHLKTGNTYFLDFGTEKVRSASPSEYIRLFGGAWSFRAVPNGNFIAPLPSEKMDEFRIAAQNGQIVSVQF